MLFDSFVFPIFFLTVLGLYWSLKSVRSQNVLILLSSYLFYGWWDWRFLTLIWISTVVDFVVAKRIDAAEDGWRRKRWLWVSVGTNLGILATFKYLGFFVESAAAILEGAGLEPNLPMLRIALPVGISFYTFQTMAYTIDVFRERFRAERDLLAFGCYVAFFPQLVAGPIERAERLLPQFQHVRTLDPARLRSGLTLIIFGLVKKIAIADNVAPFVDMVFGLEPSTVEAPLVFAATLAFALQIYADFSAYSDIARGTARLMGFELCVNFDKPYVAASPSEFWRRWHISLSQWLRDYLYIPLGGNRGGPMGTRRNLMITMVLGGLWHGAAWNYALWGFFHGAILGVYRITGADAAIARVRRVGRVVAVLIFSLLTLYGWLLFRATSFEQIVAFTAAFVGPWSDWAAAGPLVLVTCYFAIPVVAHHVLSRGLGGEKWEPAQPWGTRFVLAFVILFGILHARASQSAFIYFQF